MFFVNLSLILDIFHFIAFIFHLVPAPGAPGGARLGRGGLSMSLPVPAPAMRLWAFGSSPRDARAPFGAKSQKARSPACARLPSEALETLDFQNAAFTKYRTLISLNLVYLLFEKEH